MANKTINLNSKKSNLSKSFNETFIDISMQSKFDKSYTNRIISKNVDVDAVKNSIRNIFTWIKGERILDPEFGTELYKLLYNPINTYTTEQITAEIKSAISKFEPRAEIDKVINTNLISNTEDNTIELEIIWHVVGLPDTKYSEKIIY